MLYREISRVLGLYLFCLALALCVPLVIAGYYQFVADPATHPQPHSTWAFFIALMVCIALALLCRFWWGRKAVGTLYRREGLFLVVVIWFITAFISAIPFTASGTLSDPVDAYFEAMSGLTTTGASILTAKEYNSKTGVETPIVETFPGFPPIKYTFYGTVKPVIDPQTGAVLATGVEAVSRALLFWRSFLQWIGGMGIVMLFLAILPALGVGGKVLYQAEVPGPMKEALTPRIRDTAGLLWKLYLGLSILEICLLMLTNWEMPLFDAVCITMSNISTGGFTIKNASIASYNNLATELVVMAFMFLGSLNFVLYTYILRRKFRRIFEPEFNVYVLWLIVMIGIIAWNLVGTAELLLTPDQQGAETFSLVDALRYGSFQLLSIQTSTGFANADFNYWPYTTQVILLAVMFIGGMSGSTAGGMKMIRHTILARLTALRIELMFRPQTVRTLRIGASQIDSNRATTVLTFFFIVMALALVGTFLLVADGVDPETSLSVNASMLNNIGAGFRAGGPTHSFAFLSQFGQFLSIIWMVLGRLEFFALLIIFIPEFWRR